MALIVPRQGDASAIACGRLSAKPYHLARALRIALRDAFLFPASVMPRTITRLVLQQRNKRRVNVHLDGEYAFSLADALAAALFVGQTLTEEAIADLRARDAYQRGMDKALRLLARRSRSEREIDESLRQAEYSDSVRARILARLREMAYLDDRAFAQWWVENRVQFSPRSLRALRQELVQKGLPRSLIDEVLAPLDDDQLALAAGKMRAYRWRHLPRADFEKKMIGYLQRRGFDFATARQTALTLMNSEDE